MNSLVYISIILLFIVFVSSVLTRAYSVPRYADFYKYPNETRISYFVRRWLMFKNSLKKRVHFLLNFLRFSALAPFFYEQIFKGWKDLFNFYKRFNKLEENKGFFELFPTIIAKTAFWVIKVIIIWFILTYIFLGHIWLLKNKFDFHYNPPEAYVLINIYILSIICLSNYSFIGRFLLKRTIYYETPVRFIEKNEPENLYKPDWNHFSLLKLEDPLHPGKLLSPKKLEDITKKYKSLDVLIDNTLIETYGQYFIKGHYDKDLKNLTYNPQSFSEDSFFYFKGEKRKYWHELELQFLNPKNIDKKDDRIPYWIREPLENWYTGIQSVFGIISFQLFQIWLQLTMNYYNIWPSYNHPFWKYSWGCDNTDNYFYAPWTPNNTFTNYLSELNIFY